MVKGCFSPVAGLNMNTPLEKREISSSADKRYFIVPGRKIMGEFLGTRVKEVDTAAVRTNPDTVGRLAVKASHGAVA